MCYNIVREFIYCKNNIHTKEKELKKLIEDVYENFIRGIPEDFKEDILNELIDQNFENYYRCKQCGKVKHISKFTILSMKDAAQTKTKECLKCYNNKIHYTQALYDTYKDKLTPEEKPLKSKEGYLLVRCKQCKKYFIPFKCQVSRRVAALNSDTMTENHLYCSEDCKQKCYLYRLKADPNKKHTQRDTTLFKEVRIKALERANNKCEICGSEERLEVHHINPVKRSPLEEFDIENLIVLCHEHHIQYGHSDKGCRLQDLRQC